MERAVDLFAAEVGLDPAEVRRRNLLPPFDEPHAMPTGVSYDCGDYLGTLEAALARSRLRRPAGRAAAAPRDG